MAGQQYVLGSHAEERARLDHQAAALERPTRVLLQAAGLASGMRVLDLGTGLGHVARLVGEIVGPGGRVVGIDQSAEVLAAARERTIAAGANHVTFVEADATAWRTSEPFDAIVTRLLLFHVADPVAVVQHHLANLKPGGLMVAVDFDIGTARTEPPVAAAQTALERIERGFRAAGASPRIGAKLGVILQAAGVESIATFGVQVYLQPNDPSGPKMIASVVRSLAAVLVKHGLVTAEELDVANLEGLIAEQVTHARAVVLMPAVVGAWGRASAR